MNLKNENDKKLISLLSKIDEKNKELLFSLLKDWSFKLEEIHQEEIERFSNFYHLSMDDPIVKVYAKLIKLDIYEKLIVKLYLNEHIEEFEENTIATIDLAIDIVYIDQDSISRKLIKNFSKNKI